jgi:hypothetical protein
MVFLLAHTIATNWGLLPYVHIFLHLGRDLWAAPEPLIIGPFNNGRLNDLQVKWFISCYTD